MKFTSAAAVFGLAAVASAQNNNPSAPPAGGPSIPQIGSAISQQCLSSIISIATSPAASCVNLQGLAPLATANGSIVPVLDKWMTGLCSSQPCSNATLANVTQAIGSGCASDLAKYNVSNSTLNDIISNYPLAREVLCLKTTQPANLTNATIPLTQPPYNLTNGTFCVTSLLTEVSAYTGANLTLNTIYQTAMGGLQAAEQLVSRFPKNFLCQDCVFGAVDIVLRKYPQVANVSLMYNGMSNATVGNVVNGICPSNYTWTTNGTLPSTLRPTAVNSTFQYNLTVGNMTYSPANVSARRSFIDVTAAKRRMIGQI